MLTKQFHPGCHHTYFNITQFESPSRHNRYDLHKYNEDIQNYVQDPMNHSLVYDSFERHKPVVSSYA